jgi:hypothetical protein
VPVDADDGVAREVEQHDVECRGIPGTGSLPHVVIPDELTLLP